MKTIHEPAREIPVLAEVDVLVAGGGPSGLMAAQAAAADGKSRVMLVESRGYLGGNLTIGLPILAFLGPRETRWSRARRRNSSTGCGRVARRADTSRASST